MLKYIIENVFSLSEEDAIVYIYSILVVFSMAEPKKMVACLWLFLVMYEHCLVFSHFFHVHSHDLGADLLLSRFIRKVLNLLVFLCRSNFWNFILLLLLFPYHFYRFYVKFANSNLKLKNILWKFILWIFAFDVPLHKFFSFLFPSDLLLVLMTKMCIESFKRHNIK